MKFVVSSTSLLDHLTSINRVISNKNTLPILDNFLFQIVENELTITSSDLETTMQTKMMLENTDGEGSIAIEAKRLTDTLKELPEQPLTFDIDLETLGVDILTENGKFSVVGQDGENFPVVPEIKEEISVTISMPAEALLTGISKTLFATADDELRPVMNGVLLEFTSDALIFVATDAHKLVRLRRFDVKVEEAAKFILPKKPASLLKNLLMKSQHDVEIIFDEKNAMFTIGDFKVVCRLTEGTYPNYESVIPTNNPNKLIIDRSEFLNTIKRVSVFSNQASNLIRLKLSSNLLTVSAQDIDFSISAYERLNCQYEGEEMEIGFKSTFLAEIIANVSNVEVVFEMSDPSRAGVLTPYERDNYDTDIVMLVMPMMINV